jgi:HTH-type transcriptional regulator / antitoxin HigA
MQTKKKISTQADYKKVMHKIDSLMAKGSGAVTKRELAQIRKLAVSAQKYETNKFIIEPPETLAGIIEMKMFERKLKQKDLAHELHISNTKLSLIMSGKQRPDVDFLKAMHMKLGVDAEFLLSVV